MSGTNGENMTTVPFRKDKSHDAWESWKRSFAKTFFYRVGSLLTVTPLTALTAYFAATGHLDLSKAFLAILAGTALSNIVYNSLYYFLAKRVAAKLHFGYKIKRQPAV